MAFTHSSSYSGTTANVSSTNSGNAATNVPRDVTAELTTGVEQVKTDIQNYPTGTSVPGVFVFDDDIRRIVSIDMRTTERQPP